ncbi:MAG TPA: vWA domain-containing protein [Pyrinomonadaceae bacterium]
MMNRFSIRLAAALMAFLFGITASAAFIATNRVRPEDVPAPPLVDSPQTLKQSGQSLEMVFVLDTTGSMGGLLEGAKQRIWGIVNEVMQTSSRPSVRIGLVAYRDRGDAYVTQIVPLTDDLDRVYTTLMDFNADGGGDTPENVRRALSDGVHKAGWSRPSGRVAQILFLVGDAPPHDDYQDEPAVEKTVSEAVSRGMIVNTIQCGQMPQTTPIWQQIARGGEGQYFAIAQDGGVEVVSTPYDSRLSELGSSLGRTFTAYGGGGGEKGEKHRDDAFAAQAATESKVAESAAPTAAADRAINKALNSRAYVGDLLQDVENGTLKLDSVKDEDLPADLKKLSADERSKEIQKRLDDRKKMRAEIVALSKQRDEHIATERRKRTGGQGGFDSAVATALKAQLARKGIK